MNESKIGSFESIALVLSVIINHLILNLPKAILSTTSSAAPINVLFISIIALLLTYLIGKLLNQFPNLDLLDISEFLGGKWLKNLIGILFLAYFIFVSSVLLRNFSESLKIIYFQRAPVALIIILFIIVIAISNKLGFKAIVRANLIIIPIVLASILFIFIANIKNYTFERMFPIFGYGFNPTFLSGISNLFAFSGIAYLYFLPPLLDEKKNFNRIAMISTIISAIFLLSSITSLLFLFPFICSSEEIMPLYLASRYIEFGRFLQRLDAIFLLVWIISIACYLSIAINICIQIFKRITNLKESKPLVYPFSLLLFSISLIPSKMVHVRFLENTVYKYLALILIFGISIVLLIISAVKKKHIEKLKELKGGQT